MLAAVLARCVVVQDWTSTSCDGARDRVYWIIALPTSEADVARFASL
jgi:hypothetical protein